MDITLEQYNRVQQYLDGEMTNEQQKEFLLELSGNTDLNESYEGNYFLIDVETARMQKVMPINLSDDACK